MQKKYPLILVIGSIIGLLASFILTIDTIKLIENPNVELPCNLNPFISCTSVATAWQGSVLGFPNSLLGIIFFSIFLTAGIILMTGGNFSKKFSLFLNFLSLGAMLSVFWFFYQSVYQIGSLCLYCMTVWSITWPIFLYTTIWNNLSLPSKLREFITKNHLSILIIWYVAIIVLILFRFRDFFLY